MVLFGRLLVAATLLGTIGGAIHFLYPAFSASTADPQVSAASASSRLRHIPVDIGSVRPKSVTSREVQVENSSNSTWTLETVTTDCGCLSPSLTPSVIPPGSSAILKIGFSAPNSVGRVERNVNLSFREPGAPSIAVHIVGVVQPWCYAVPSEVDLGLIQPTDAAQWPSRMIRLHLREGEQLNLASPSSPPWLKVSVVDEPAAPDAVVPDAAARGKDHSRLVQLTLVGAPSTKGEYSGKVRFDSVDDATRFIEVPIRMTVAGPLTSSPGRIFLGTRRRSEVITEKIAISSARLRPDELRGALRITHDLGQILVASIDAAETPDSVVQLRCQLTMPEAAGYVSGSMTLMCGNSDSLVIPVTARIE